MLFKAKVFLRVRKALLTREKIKKTLKKIVLLLCTGTYKF